MKKEILNLIEGEVEKVVNEAYDEWDIEAERKPTKRDQEVYKRNVAKLEKFKQIRKEQIAELKLIGDGWQKEFRVPGQLSVVYDTLNSRFLTPDDIKKGPADTSDIDKQLDNVDEGDYEWDESYRSHIDDLKRIKKARVKLANLVSYSERILKLAKKYQNLFLPGGELFELYTTPKKIFKLKPEQVERLWNELSFHIKDSTNVDDVHKVAEINKDFMNAVGDGIRAQRELEKLSMGGGEVVEENKLSPNAMAEISNNVFETLFLQLQNSRKNKERDFLAGLNLTYNTDKIMSIDKNMGSLSIMENKQPPIFLLEEMTKTEIKDLVKDEIKNNLEKMVRDELEKMLKDNRQVKNQIGDLSKEILKMLYKDLSIHHGYVIDRVKF